MARLSVELLLPVLGFAVYFFARPLTTARHGRIDVAVSAFLALRVLVVRVVGRRSDHVEALLVRRQFAHSAVGFLADQAQLGRVQVRQLIALRKHFGVTRPKAAVAHKGIPLGARGSAVTLLAGTQLMHVIVAFPGVLFELHRGSAKLFAERLSNHVLHAVLADTLHVALVPKHAAQVVHTLLVTQPCLVELLIILLELLLIHLLRALRVIHVLVLFSLRIRITRCILPIDLHQLVALLYFAQEFILRHHADILRVFADVLVAALLEGCSAIVQVLARLNLLEAVALARHLGQRLLDELTEGARILHILEYLPVVLLRGTLQTLEVLVLHRCLREGRTLHADHEDRGADGEHVCLLTVVLRMRRQSAQFGFDLRTVVDRLLLWMLLVLQIDSLRPRLQLAHLLLSFLQVDVVVPNFGSVVALRANVLAPVNVWIVVAFEKLIAVHLWHPDSKAEICDDQLSFTIYQQVLWLDVSMHDAVSVKVASAFNQLVEDVARHAFAESCLGVLKEAVKLAELGQLHDVVHQV